MSRYSTYMEHEEAPAKINDLNLKDGAVVEPR